MNSKINSQNELDMSVSVSILFIITKELKNLETSSRLKKSGGWYKVRCMWCMLVFMGTLDVICGWFCAQNRTSLASGKVVMSGRRFLAEIGQRRAIKRHYLLPT